MNNEEINETIKKILTEQGLVHMLEGLLEERIKNMTNGFNNRIDELIEAKVDDLIEDKFENLIKDANDEYQKNWDKFTKRQDNINEFNKKHNKTLEIFAEQIALSLIERNNPT